MAEIAQGGAWRRALTRLAVRLGLTPPGDPRRSPPSPPEPPPVLTTDRLDEIERACLGVYARAGLPDAPGHYARPPNARDWEFIAETLTPEERFRILDRHPSEEGWRFGRLAEVGRFDEDAGVRRASQMLAQVDRLRDPQTGDRGRIDGALELGELWRALRDDGV